MQVTGRFRRWLESDPRLKRVLQGGLSGIAGRGMAMLVSAVTLPLTVRYLGAFEYGIWVTISTSVVMFAVLDLGIANTLTNFISKAYASDDEPMAASYFATAFWLTVAIVCLLGLLAAIAWRAIDWGALLHIPNSPLAAQARLCVAIAIAFFLASLPLNLANRVLSGYQRTHIANFFAMINSLLGLIAIVSVILLKGTIVHLMAAYSLAMLTGTLSLNLWLCFKYKPALKPSPWAMRRSMARELFGEGSLFFVLQLAGLVVFNSDNLVIAHFLGAAEVTPYSVAWRLTSYAGMLQSLFVPALWPALAEAYFRRDMTWIRLTYRRILRLTLISVGVAGIAIGLFGRWLIRAWAGPAAVPGSLLLWCMCFWIVLLAVTVNQASLMAATQRLGLQAVTSSLAAIVNAILSIVLVQRMGALGVLLATISSYLVLVVLPQAWVVRRILSGRYLKPLQTLETIPSP